MADYPEQTAEERARNIASFSPSQMATFRGLRAGYIYYTEGPRPPIDHSPDQEGRLSYWDSFIADPDPHLPTATVSVLTGPKQSSGALVTCKCGHPASVHFFKSLDHAPGCNGCKDCKGFE